MTKVYSTDLVGKKESVVDELMLLNPYQTPMISLVGFGSAVTNVEHVWFEDEMFATESTVSVALTNIATSLEVADGEAFRVGQIVKIGDEFVRVTAVAGNVLTIVRGHAGTLAAAASVGDKVEVMFVEGDEGQLARDARYKPRKRVSNLTQIFDDSVELTGTAMAINQHGVDSEYEKEKQKKLLELALQLEKAIINGVKFESGTKRLMRGIRSFIQSNVQDASAAAVNDALLTKAFQDIFEKGGFETGGDFKIIVGAKQKTAISNMDKASIRLERGENTRGVVVDKYVSDFGSAEILLNNNLAADEILIVDANRISIRPLQGRDFAHTYMGVQGDFMKGMLVGEYTLEFFQEQAHARIKNLG
jgi:hypothetical protein